MPAAATERIARRRQAKIADIDGTVFYYSLIGAAPLTYVNAPEACLLGLDTTSDAFAEAHADASIQLFLGPADRSDP
jgi:hypothetical protein